VRWFVALTLTLFALPALAQDAEEPAPPAEDPAPESEKYLGATRVTASLVVRVPDREDAAQAVIDEAEERGGWFSTFSTENVTVRVPVAEMKDLVETTRALGQVVERTFESQDLSAQLIDLDSRLKAREEVLAQYMEVLENASPKAIVTVEREVTRAVAAIEGLARLLPGVVGNPESTQRESFREGLLEEPVYTRPAEYKGITVPEVLLSGDHKAIRRWRLQQSLGRTWLRRPELLGARVLSAEEQILLDEFIQAQTNAG